MMYDSKTPSAVLGQAQEIADQGALDGRMSSVEGINGDLAHLNLFRMGT